MHTNDRINRLLHCQTVDPQRGQFHVDARPCRKPTHHRGSRVYEDAFGVKFTVEGEAQTQQVVA